MCKYDGDGVSCVMWADYLNQEACFHTRLSQPDWCKVTFPVLISSLGYFKSVNTSVNRKVTNYYATGGTHYGTYSKRRVNLMMFLYCFNKAVSYTWNLKNKHSEENFKTGKALGKHLLLPNQY